MIHARPHGRLYGVLVAIKVGFLPALISFQGKACTWLIPRVVWKLSESAKTAWRSQIGRVTFRNQQLLGVFFSPRNCHSSHSNSCTSPAECVFFHSQAQRFCVQPVHRLGCSGSKSHGYHWAGCRGRGIGLLKFCWHFDEHFAGLWKGQEEDDPMAVDEEQGQGVAYSTEHAMSFYLI